MTLFSRFIITCITTLFIAVSPSSFADTVDTDPMYQGLGGKEGIRNIVNTFLPIVMEDKRIKDSFNDADLERLAAMLTEQFCELSGGPCKYSGEDMKSAHADMALNNVHFNALAEDLQIAMEKHGVSPRVQNKLLAKLAPMQRDVVTK